MIINYNNLSDMLRLSGKNIYIRWDHFFIFKDYRCQSFADIDFMVLFNIEFRLFSYSYQIDLKKTKLFNLLSHLNLSEFEERFKNAISGRPGTKNSKLTKPREQLKLASVFKVKPENTANSAKELTISPRHYNSLINIFNIGDADNDIKAQTLFSIATVFTALSSSRFFGTEYQSPQILRNYASALIVKAHQLDNKTTGPEFEYWINILLGLDDGFTCTAVLANEMMSHARGNFMEVASLILPPTFR